MSFSVVIPEGTRIYRATRNACEDVTRAEVDEPGVEFATFAFLPLVQVLQEPGNWEFASFVTRTDLVVKLGYADPSENVSYFEPNVEPEAYVQMPSGEYADIWGLLRNAPAPRTNGLLSLTGLDLRRIQPEMPVHRIDRDMLIRYFQYAYRLAVRIQDPNPLLLFAPYDIGLYIQRGILTPISCEVRVNPELAGGRKRAPRKKRSRSAQRKKSRSRSRSVRRKKSRSRSRSRSRR
jgi:hypothetical protein